MSIGYAAVAVILQSPRHRLLSRSTDPIRFEGRKTGRTIFPVPCV